MKIYLLRHGLTDACFKQTKMKDVCLSDTGIRQIHDLLDHLPGSIKTIYCSPTLRTIESAEIIQKRLGCKIVVDGRIKNKLDESNPDYFQNLQTFLSDLPLDKGEILLVSHGRIIKMIYSIINHHKIDKDVIDHLEIDYGDLFCLETTEDHTLVFKDWKKLNGAVPPG